MKVFEDECIVDGKLHRTLNLSSLKSMFLTVSTIILIGTIKLSINSSFEMIGQLLWRGDEFQSTAYEHLRW